MRIIAIIAEALRSFWRPTLAFTIVAIILTNYLILPVFFHTQPYELPDQFWELALWFSLFYAGFRMVEKVSGGQVITFRDIIELIRPKKKEREYEDYNDFEYDDREEV